MSGPSRTRRLAISANLDHVLFGFAGVASAWMAWLLLREGLREGWQALLLVLFYLLVAYLVLPRLHRMLTYLYLPGYFIGRARTSDGLLGDPVNLAVVGDEARLHAAMTAAGWIRADPVTLRSSIRIVTSTLSGRSYPQAPVSPLLLFGRQQDFAYQQEAEGSPSARHHVRFWRCPDDWMLPGGYAVDWVAAGTYDRSVGLSLLTFQVTHRIAPDIDAERDHIAGSLRRAVPGVEVRVIRNFSTGYHSRNGGGDRIATDGDLPIIDLGPVLAGAPGDAAPATDSRARRPVTTVFGAGIAALLGVYHLGLAVLATLTPTYGGLATVGSVGGTMAAYAVIGLVGLTVAVLTFLGDPGARLLMMLGCAVPIVVAFVDDVRVAGPPTLTTNLPSVVLGILALLALTSHRSRDFADSRGRLPAGATGEPAAAIG